MTACTWCGRHDHRPFEHGGLIVDPDWDGQAPFPFLAPSTALASLPTWTLDAKDMARADAYAHRMHERGKRKHDRLNTQSLLDNRIMSARSEVSLSRLTGLPAFLSDTGYGKPDVGPYQVRHSNQGRLKVAKYDPGHVPLVAMSGRGDTYQVRGWTPRAAPWKVDDYLDDPRGWGPAWFVPWALLLDPWTLPELAPGRVASTASGT